MKRLATLFALTLVACSSSESAPATTPDASAPAADAGVDASVDPQAALVEAVKATSWTKLASGPSVLGQGKQDDLFFASKTLGFAVNGPSSAIYRTKDAGATWQKVFEHKGTFFRSVLFTDELHGFAGNLGAGLTPSIDDKTALYETKDGGDTWAPVTAITGPDMPGVCNLTAADNRTLFAVGRANGPASMLASTDGGSNWVSTDLSKSFSMLIDARFTSANEGILAGQNVGSPATCTIMRTTDGGKTLETVFASKTKNSLCWKLHFPTPEVGYVAVQDSSSGPPSFGKTTDGGKTWTEMPLPDGGNPRAPYSAIGIGFLTAKIGWVSPEDGKKPTYRTFDGGETWEEAPDLVAPINRFRFVDERTAYAIGANTWKLELPAR